MFSGIELLTFFIELSTQQIHVV